MAPDIILLRTGINVRAVKQGDDACVAQITAQRHYRF